MTDVIGEEQVDEHTHTRVLRRRKRQTWVFVTHNSRDNKTEVREFSFKTVSVQGTVCAGERAHDSRTRRPTIERTV